MNAAFVMLTSAWLAGADAAPAPPVAAHSAAPAVVATGSGCCSGGCGSSYAGGSYSGGYDSCGSDACCESGGGGRKRGGLFGKLRGKFKRGGKGGADCCEQECAPVCPPPCPPKPVCCTPAPVCPPAPVCHDDCADACGTGCDQGGGRKKLFGRMKGRKRGGNGGDDCCHDNYGGCDACTSGCGGGTVVPHQAIPHHNAPITPVPNVPAGPGVEPKKMPTTIGGAPAVITPAKIGSESRNPFDFARQYEGKASASPDHSKLTGQLSFVHTDGGRWVLRYAPISTDDRFGGSVVLSRDSNLAAFREGDIVSVEGEVLSEKSGARLGGAHFRANRLSLVERGQGKTER